MIDTDAVQVIGLFLCAVGLIALAAFLIHGRRK